MNYHKPYMIIQCYNPNTHTMIIIGKEVELSSPSQPMLKIT